MVAEVLFQSSLYGVRFWEVKVIDGDRSHRIDVSVTGMKRLGVATSLRSTKKLLTWLNETEDGQKYLAEKIGKKVSA
ncbi:hypothetical protein [Paenibacillus harenae]|uniref:hypothetical protein n=1 Tax=Paenibacillus harenae TaxID=306543 RepID=UPI00278E729B|nr:hypothetical protein [Paenibacillus harenae]MDQ0062356.1 hypothetical protein [Paenibacillus harenae]